MNGLENCVKWISYSVLAIQKNCILYNCILAIYIGCILANIGFSDVFVVFWMQCFILQEMRGILHFVCNSWICVIVCVWLSDGDYDIKLCLKVFLSFFTYTSWLKRHYKEILFNLLLKRTRVLEFRLKFVCRNSWKEGWKRLRTANEELISSCVRVTIKQTRLPRAMFLCFPKERKT